MACLQPGSSPTRGIRVAQVGRRADGWACRLHYQVLLGNRVNIGWLLLCVFPADGVRVARAGRPGRRDHVHVAGKLRLAFALDLSREACKFRLAFARGLAGQRSQSCRGTVIVVVLLLLQLYVYVCCSGVVVVVTAVVTIVVCVNVAQLLVL